jgi:hypothetical protein
VQRLSPYPSLGFWRGREQVVRRGVVTTTDVVHGTVAAFVVRCCSGDLGAARPDASAGLAHERRFWTASVGAKAASDDRDVHSDAVGANAVNFKQSRHVAHVRAIDAGQRVCQVNDRRVCRIREEQQTLDRVSVH